jgi:L-seryl-tRNA(Ser) seleniumtransferase
VTTATEALRWLPAVHACLSDPPLAVGALGAGERLERAALDHALEAVRSETRLHPERFADRAAVIAAVEEAWRRSLETLTHSALRPVINATGVVVHTNLGRAPLADEAARAAAVAATHYTPLEYDLARGVRGSRYAHASALLRAATGAEDALVVNNNAAALLLAVDTLASISSENPAEGTRPRCAVVISRGELIEIGGGFRIHEILAKSSARLVEVGATNKTHAEDYEAALANGDVAVLLKVHRSNFAQSGFVAEVALEDLCRIGREAGVPVVFDQGTGILETAAASPQDEPTVRGALEAGAALVCASGDKLLGGPQAGIVVGDREWIARLRTNPLLRALRVDKMTLAALEATLRLSLVKPEDVPVRRIIETPSDALEVRARGIASALGPAARARVEVVRHAGRTGGGTLPAVELPGWAVRVRPPGSVAAFDAALRAGEPPIVARVVEEAVWIDVRALLPGEPELVAARLDELLTDQGSGKMNAAPD